MLGTNYLHKANILLNRLTLFFLVPTFTIIQIWEGTVADIDDKLRGEFSVNYQTCVRN